MARATETATGRHVTWALVEDGFHVGSRDGEFIGYIERHSHRRFEAFNLYSRHVGTFGELTAAMRALSLQHPEVLTEVRPEGSR